MTELRNPAGKLVCCLDKHRKEVEIVHKGYKTTIRFMPDNTTEIVTSTTKKAV